MVETKGSLFAEDLRDKENGKVRCGEEHFKAIATGGNPVRFVKATKLKDVLAHN